MTEYAETALHDYHETHETPEKKMRNYGYLFERIDGYPVTREDVTTGRVVLDAWLDEDRIKTKRLWAALMGTMR